MNGVFKKCHQGDLQGPVLARKNDDHSASFPEPFPPKSNPIIVDPFCWLALLYTRFLALTSMTMFISKCKQYILKKYSIALSCSLAFVNNKLYKNVFLVPSVFRDNINKRLQEITMQQLMMKRHLPTLN